MPSLLDSSKDRLSRIYSPFLKTLTTILLREGVDIEELDSVSISIDEYVNYNGIINY